MLQKESLLAGLSNTKEKLALARNEEVKVRAIRDELEKRRQPLEKECTALQADIKQLALVLVLMFLVLVLVVPFLTKNLLCSV